MMLMLMLRHGMQYVSEAVTSIVEANVKGKDVNAAAKVQQWHRHVMWHVIMLCASSC